MVSDGVSYDGKVRQYVSTKGMSSFLCRSLQNRQLSLAMLVANLISESSSSSGCPRNQVADLEYVQSTLSEQLPVSEDVQEDIPVRISRVPLLSYLQGYELCETPLLTTLHVPGLHVHTPMFVSNSCSAYSEGSLLV